MKTKYQPKAGDVCEWSYYGEIIQVMIISPSKNEYSCYEGFGLGHIDKSLRSYPWHCKIKDLKLIYRP